MRKHKLVQTFLLSMAISFSSCSITRYVPEGNYLLDNVRLDVEGEEEVNLSISQLRGLVRQNPNARFFSLFKMPLATYSLSGRDSTQWLNRMLRSIGEPPVVFDSIHAVRTALDLKQELRNEGYMRAEVSFDVDYHRKKADVMYHLKPGLPYFINNVKYRVDDPELAALLRHTADSTRRLLTEGMKFDVSRLDAERKRLTSLMNDNGYYRFHKEYITYEADTVEGSRMIDVTLNIGLYKRNNYADTLHTKYTIDKISFVSGDPNDNRLHLRRHVLEECTHLEEGKTYSGTNLQHTYNHFGRLQAVKYTNISIVQHPDTNLLDCNITLQTNKPSTISFQPEGTNTAGDFGAAASLTYQNRNLFRGSEVFSVELRGAYEAIKGLEGYNKQDFTEYSIETRLAFPRFVLPWFYHSIRHKALATSELSLLYDMQDRPEFHRRVLSAGWRYKWNFMHRHDRYQLDLLDLNYVFMPWISDTFRHEYLESENSRNAILRYNYEDLFITKIGFGYAYNHNNLAVKTNIETSGNVLSIGAALLGKEKDDRGQYRLFNIAFAQYIKGDMDLTHSLRLDNHNHLVFHLGLGIAYPYGNSDVLPFEKRYFSGGANSVRGWSVRSLGPGKFKEHDGRINFINQTGDMKLDLNAEYRTHLFWKLGGAFFIDAGNIWTLRDYKEQPGGQFRLNEFISQLAVGYGLGFRFNFDYFVLRFDLGMKAINPAYETDGDEHYPFLHPRLGRDMAFHFAVGLPF